MFRNDISYLYSDEYLASSKALFKNELSTRKTKFIEYGPIRIRVCRKPAPTLATGRRSKHIVLFGDEAAKREKRREKNRLAARRLKEKRQSIEKDLHQKVKELEYEQSHLKHHLIQLQSQKDNLENKVNNKISRDPIIELISTVKEELPLFFDEFTDDFDLFSESIPTLLCFSDDTNDDSKD